MICFRKDDIREAALKGLSPSKIKESKPTFYPNYLDMCNFLFEKVRKTIFCNMIVKIICISTLLFYISYTRMILLLASICVSTLIALVHILGEFNTKDFLSPIFIPLVNSAIDKKHELLDI